MEQDKALSYSHNMKQISRAAGLWKFDYDVSSWKGRIYKIYSKVLWGFFVSYTVNYIFATPHALRSPETTYQHVSFMIIYAGYVIKGQVARSDSVQNLVKLVEVFDNEMKNDNEKAKEIYKAAVKRANRLYWTIAIPVAVFPAYYCFLFIAKIYQSLGESPENNELMFESWFPFDSQKYYIIALTYQEIFVWVAPVFTDAADCLIIGLIAFGCLQLNLLNHRIEHYKLYLGGNITYNDEILYSYFRQCVIKHQKIIRFIQNVDSSINMIMLVDFMVKSAVLASLVWQVIIIGWNVQFVAPIALFIINSTPLFLFYWYANEITFNGKELCTHVYCTDWIDFSVRVRRMLLVIMMRSGRPIGIHIGSLYIMSNSTLLRIGQSMYSFLALMYKQSQTNNEHEN